VIEHVHVEKHRREVSRQQRRSSATHQKLLDAAHEVFAAKGFGATRIDDITERADVGKGTFYYHFGSKERVIQEVMASVLGELVALLEVRCAGISDLRDLLDTLIGAHIEFFCNRWADFVLHFQGRTDLTLENSYEGMEAPFVDYLECVEGLLASVLKERVSAAVLRRIACAVAGFTSGYYSFAAITSEEEDVDATFRGLRGAIVAGLARFVQEALPSSRGQAPGA